VHRRGSDLGGAGHGAGDDDMVFPSYRQQGILITRGYPLVDMINQIYSNRRTS
jgi:2-oxoisovalerate dehydrogenase E1 component alpha subunit